MNITSTMPIYTANMILTPQGLMAPRALPPMTLIDLMGRHLETIGPLPQKTLYFGISNEDGLPVLLNIGASSMGSLKILGESGTGKTTLLQIVATGIACSFLPEAVQFVVITERKMEWNGWDMVPQCSGIFSISENLEKLLDGLLIWMERTDRTQSLIILIDGMEIVIQMGSKFYEKMQNLLLLGPTCNIWPIVTAIPQPTTNFSAWSNCFDKHLVSLSTHENSIFRLNYALKEGNTWSSFSLFG